MSGRRLPRSRGGTAIAIAVAVAALSLAACGGDDGGDGGGGGASDSKKLALGTEAVVEYVTTASGNTPAVNTKLGVTALAIRKGTQAELTKGGLKVEAKDKSKTPYYVDARFANKGSGSLTRNLGVSMEDADGGSLPKTLVFSLDGSTYKPCPNINKGTLKPGQSYEGCSLFLVPEGKEPALIRFVSQGANAKITFSEWAPS